MHAFQQRQACGSQRLTRSTHQAAVDARLAPYQRACALQIAHKQHQKLHVVAASLADATGSSTAAAGGVSSSSPSLAAAAAALNGNTNGNGNGAHSAAAAAAVLERQSSAAAASTSTSTSASGSAIASTDGELYEGIQMAAQRLPGLYVRVRDMVKHFNTAKGVFKAVQGIDVDIEPSTIVALLGPSGSGKTTLLRLVAGLEAPTSGRILFDDDDATDLTVQDRQVGMVFQSYALFNHMTVAENIRFGLEVRGLDVDRDKRVDDLLELVQLAGLGARFPRQLSGGQRQRVALARALASNPRLLLLDEPFGALDAVVRRQLRAGLKEIVRTVGVTTIIVTHDQEEAFDLADRVVVFNRGYIEQVGTPTEIIRRPATPFVMKFVGDTNDVPAAAALVRRSRFVTDKSRVMFRPTDMQIYTGVVETAPDGRPTTGATVAERAVLGFTARYTLRFDDDVEVEFTAPLHGGGAAVAAAPGASGGSGSDAAPPTLDVGQRVYVYVKPEAMMGFDPADVDSAPIV